MWFRENVNPEQLSTNQNKMKFWERNFFRSKKNKWRKIWFFREPLRPLVAKNVRTNSRSPGSLVILKNREFYDHSSENQIR
ncbi:hypothetical protein CH354_11625 [Leptospira levettii]|nr:hypothetical protein CH354_11625 [Leptospira levettii]PKA00212.1 hypothetical protein CH369_11810 [Leptospira levettii]